MSLTDLSSVRRPVATAKGLPNAHYVDDAVFEEERKSVLSANWAGIGFAHDVPSEGDVKPVELLGVPLLIVRGHDGGVRVYQNTCRHRGMILIDQPTNVRGTIRCPYHSWCYGLDGKLRSTPHVGGPGNNIHEDIKRDDLGLIEMASHVWLGVVYVNVDGKAAPFEKMHADVMARWAEFDRPLHYGGPDSGFDLDVACNWKLAVENYCESYHLPWVHPGLNSYSRLEDHYNIEEIGRYSGQGSLVYKQLEGKNGETFPDFEGLDAKWDTGSEYLTVFPNVMLGVHRDHVFAIVLEPKAKDRTVEHIRLLYSDAAVLDDGFGDLRTRNAAQWKEVFKEDIFVVEGMQRGRLGPEFDGGKFSPAMDGPTHVFHDWVAAQVEAGRAIAAE